MIDIANVSRAAKLMREAQSILGSGPLDFYLSEMAACYNLLMQRFAPFKVGDRVALSVTPNLDDAPGWQSCEHFLKSGAQGIVREASCGEGGFSFAIEFDDETWIDRDGKKQPMTNKHVFHFREASLEIPRPRARGKA